MRVVIDAPLVVSVGNRRVKEPGLLKELDGLTDPKEPLEKCLSESLLALGLGGGYLRCHYDSEANTLRIVTEFESPRRLTKQELGMLVKETQGQWLDGVGESFFDGFCDAYDSSVEVSSRVKVEQDKGQAWKPAKGTKPKKFKKQKPKATVSKTAKTAALTKLLFKAETVEQVKSLLESGADPNAKDKDGQSAITGWELLGNPAIVRLFLDHGADINGVSGYLKRTPLMEAAAHGERQTVKFLLSAGASVNLVDTEKETALSLAVSNPLDADPVTIRALLGAGARITPGAIVEAGKRKDPKIVQTLLDAGGDVNASITGKLTALSSAVWAGNAAVVKALLKAGASPNCKICEFTALAYAKECGKSKIVKLLQAAGAKK